MDSAMPKQPLHNKRIVVTRPQAQASALIARLRELGAEPLACPAITIVPPADYTALDRTIASLDQYDWLIVTSANGVRALLGRMAALGADVAPLRRLRVGAIGPATAQALAEHGLAASFIPTAYVAEAILDQIGDVAEQRILLPRADIAREALAAGLRQRGALVDEIAAYRTVPGAGVAELAAELQAGAIDAVTFTSSSTVRYLLDGLEAAGLDRPAALALLQGAAIVCIGPITAATAQAEGLHVDAVACEYTGDGLVAALVEWFEENDVPTDRTL
jgi:uroporphyrinogen III methyltransferase/synthase